jgi:hypothetical protein
MESISSLANRGEETGWSKKAEGFLAVRMLNFVVNADLLALVKQTFALST